MKTISDETDLGGMGADPEDVTTEEIEFEEFKKRPVFVGAKKMEDPFVVDTLEGENQHGKAGDYLVEGIEGERYPVDADIFESTYRAVEPEASERPHERREWIPIDWTGEVAQHVAEAVLDVVDAGDRNDEVHLQRIHIEIEEGDTRINGAEVLVVESE